MCTCVFKLLASQLEREMATEEKDDLKLYQDCWLDWLN